MNSIGLLARINGAVEYTDLSDYVALPVTVADLLDEQLDETSITLKNCPIEYIEPMTVVKFVVTNKSNCFYSLEQAEEIVARSDYKLEKIGNKQWASVDGEKEIYIELNSDNTLTIQYSVDMIIANDTAIEMPVGSGRYTHELYLIEYTKIAEGFIGDNLTFTNSLGSTYGKSEKQPVPFVIENKLTEKTYETNSDTRYVWTPQYTSLTLPSMEELVNMAKTLKPNLDIGDLKKGYSPGSANAFEKGGPFQSVKVEKGNIIYYEYEVYFADSHKFVQRDVYYYRAGIITERHAANDENLVPYNGYSFPETSISVANGNYKITYTWWDNVELWAWKSTFNITVSPTAEDVLPTKKLTITDVVDRLCDVIEPLAVRNETADKPRFYLNAKQREKYKDVFAPEFSFTKMTFREQLQQVGGFIHAEPRLKPKITTNDNGKFEYRAEIWFDEYGSEEQSHIQDETYIASGFKTDINEYCTGIDSSADNLINQLDFAQGVVFSPFQTAYISVRTETTTTQVKDEDTTFIPTSLPIYKIQAVYCNYNGNRYDITPYVFEAADYNGLLNSYQGTYPYAKYYALYYSQGSKNIKGLFYRQPSASSPNPYAISNILSSVSGSMVDLSLESVIKLGFEIDYIPIYSTRVKSSKQTVGIGTPRNITYNQSENLIETRYYSQHLQGVVERLGNVEKNYSYLLPNYTDIPKAGYLFDDNYYISTVTTEIQEKFYKSTVGLSKNFNRLSSYVGVNSNKRMWEISEKQSVSRQSVIQDFLVFSFDELNEWNTGKIFKEIESDSSFWLMWFFPKSNNDDNHPVSATGLTLFGSLEEEEKEHCTLTTTSSAIGNSAVFTCEFEDNYSAGQKIEQSGSTYYSNYARYTDKYGQITKMSINLYSVLYLSLGSYIREEFPGVEMPNNGSVQRYGYGDIYYRKDNREIPQLNFQLTAVCGTSTANKQGADGNNYDYEDKDLIIGIGLMKNSTLVTTSVTGCSCVLLNEKLSRVSAKKSWEYNIVDNAPFDVSINGNLLFYKDNPLSHVAWGIFTGVKLKDITVVNDKGVAETQTIRTGGDLVIGANTPLPKSLYAAILNRNPADKL